MKGGLLMLPRRLRFERELLLFLLFDVFDGIPYCCGFFKAGGHWEEVGKSYIIKKNYKFTEVTKVSVYIVKVLNFDVNMNYTWPLIRLIVAEAGSNCADLREFFLRRLGSSGRLLLFAVLKTTPITQ